MPERIQLSDELRNRLLDPEQLPNSVKVGGKEYRCVKPVDAGYKSAVWKVQDEFGRDRALKLAIYEDYVDRSYLEELSLAARLEPYPEFAKFVDADLVRLAGLPRQEFVVFVEEWIDGVTLEDFLIQQPSEVTASFFVGYVRALCNVLQALRTHNLTHDDLHTRNIMLARPPEGSLTSEWAVKIIDTGSLKEVQRKKKRKDDHRHFVEHLVLIWNTMHRRRNLPIRERRFLREAERLLRTMLDNDPSIALRDPAQIVEQFEHASTRAESPHSGARLQMSAPFEFISAEHIADDSLLVDIFARSCPWLGQVDGPDPCLVTGPRGCGKSTIFRWLSLKAHLDKQPAEIAPQIIGFYISCSSDLQNRIGWIQSREAAQRFRSEIVHYFNLLCAREVVHTLQLISRRADRESYWGFGKSQEVAIHRFLMEALAAGSRPRIQGVSYLDQAMEAIEAEMFTTHSQMRRGLNCDRATPETFLGDLTTLLVKNVPAFKDKKIAFLIDDFSDYRLPREVQGILNRVIWERRGSHVFKLSAEKHGAFLSDPFGATVDITREMLEIDCGREYIALDDAHRTEQARTFATDLLNLRLAKANYKGTADSLIGHSHWPEGSLARALRKKEPGSVRDEYHGLECIADLCSGDISTLLFVYRKVFGRGGVTKDSNSQISRTNQHQAIVSASRELLEAMKAHFPYGPEMYDVANAYGNLVRRILEGREIKKGSERIPDQCPRIEVDQKRGGAVHQFNEQQLGVATELVKRSVFIEMEPGLSRHRNVTTLRWHFRRVYLPTFGAALAKNDAVKRDPEWLKWFLTNPVAACTKELAMRGISGTSQQLAFEDVGGTEGGSPDGKT